MGFIYGYPRVRIFLTSLGIYIWLLIFYADCYFFYLFELSYNSKGNLNLNFENGNKKILSEWGFIG